MLLVIYTCLDTLRECTLADVCHTIGNVHQCKSAATIERSATDVSHAVGNGHWDQTAATIERSTTDVGHAIRNDQIFDFFTIYK